MDTSTDMMLYGYTEEHIKNREPTELLFTENNQEFEVILSALYTTNYDDWIKSGSDHLDEQGRLEIIPNLFIDFIEFKRNAFNFFQILICHNIGEIYPIFQRETT